MVGANASEILRLASVLQFSDEFFRCEDAVVGVIVLHINA